MAARKKENQRAIRAVSLDVSRGMWGGGNAARMPLGYARVIRNHASKDGVLDQRAPFTYDNLAGIHGLGAWYDTASNKSRLVALEWSAAAYRLYVKSATSEAWSAALTSNQAVASSGRILDEVNYRGRWFGAVATAANGGVPERILYYDGTNFRQLDDGAWLPFAASSLALYKGRLWFGGIRLSGTNLTDGVDVYAYDPTASWTLHNVVAQAIAANGTTLYRITPTSTTDAYVRLQVPAGVADYFGGSAGAGRNGDFPVKFRSELRSVSSDYDMPITLQIIYSSDRQDSTPYTLGQIIVVPATPGFRFRCTQAGTTAAADPGYTATVGAETTDGTAKFQCDGGDVAEQAEVNILGLARNPEWLAAAVTTVIPSGAKTDLDIAIKFGTTSEPTITLAPLDFGYKDGLTATDPRKRNHGQQVTYDLFDYPFFSNETAAPFVIDESDCMYGSDPLDPLMVNAITRYEMADEFGAITAIRSDGGGKLIAFKRNARWPFAITDDANLPILPVGEVIAGVGALNAKALATGPDGALYGVGEDFVWRMKRDSEPEDICGDAMRSAMMDKSVTTWCESQAEPNNRALLTIDWHERRVYVYVQKGLIHVYNIDESSWSYIEVGENELRDMIYNRTTHNSVFAFGTAPSGTPGLARLDETVTNTYDQISDSGVLPITCQVVTRPVELSTPRYQLTLHSARVTHGITGDQSGQTTRCRISFDQGVTFTRDVEAVMPVGNGVYTPAKFDIFQSGATVTLMFEHIGRGGRENWNISSIEADVQLQGGEFPKSLPVVTSSNL